MPRILNAREDHIPREAVYIGRPSKWGNPFVIGRNGSRAEVIAAYRAWLRARPELMEAMRRELRGKDLECYCYPEACHGDVILEVANAPEE